MTGGICLVAGLLLAPLGEAITLRWTHSIQKTLWEEDYRLEANALRLVAARVRGTGAGMEPPPEAVFKEGAWHYAPALPPLPRVALRHSPHAAPHIVCVAATCRPVDAWLPGLPDEAIWEIRACDGVDAPP